MKQKSAKAKKALERAVKLADGQVALADKINQAIARLGLTHLRKVKQQNIWLWLSREWVPTDYALVIESVINDPKVNRYDLCPGRIAKPLAAESSRASV